MRTVNDLRAVGEIALPEMPPVIAPEGAVEETTDEQTTTASPSDTGEGYRVILYDDDYHEMTEVAAQIHKATQYSPARCWDIMLLAHQKGRAICYQGSRAKCHQVTRVLREIRLQCEVDCD
jgi:ATP-dependent Clp protease adapter protein ClpS